MWTNVGTAHLEFFVNEDAIADAKAEILERADAGDTLVANADDDRVMTRIDAFPGQTMTFGIDRPADVAPLTLRRPRSSTGGAPTSARRPATSMLQVPLVGRGHLANVLAAVAVAITLDVPLDAVSARAATLSPAKHRGEVLRLGDGVVVIDDSYNASPTAVRVSSKPSLRDRTARRRVAVLGEMLELGDASERLHRDAGRGGRGRRRRQARDRGRSGGPRPCRGSGECWDSTPPMSRRAARRPISPVGSSVREIW